MRVPAAVAAVAYLVQAAVLTVLLIVTAARAPLPVIATFSSDARTVVASIASVDLGWALVAVLAGGAVTHALVAASPRAAVAPRPIAEPDDGASLTRPRVMLVAGWSQGAAILVFLVARLNGIAEVSSLVPMYAIAATAVVLVGIDTGRATTWRRPGAWAAVVGIVPWGVIAFAQIGAGIAVGVPGLGVRIVTLLALAVAIYGWIITWRRPASIRTADVIAMTVGVSLVLWVTAVSAGLEPSHELVLHRALEVHR